MRRHLIFGTAILSALLVVAFFAATVAFRRPVFVSSADGLTKFFARVTAEQKPRVRLDFTSMYGWNGRFEVLDPAFTAREWKIAVPVPTCQPTVGASDQNSPVMRCDSFEASSSAERELFAKQNQLRSILRGERTASDSFLLTSPFLDENGRSFAQWLFEKDIAPLNDSFWVAEHLSLFKPSELPAVFARFGFHRENFEIVSKLSKSDLRSLVEGTPALVAGSELFLRDHSMLGFSPLNYAVYDLSNARELAGEFDLTNDATAMCLDKIGNVCWTYNSRTTIAHLEKYAWFFFAFALAALAFASVVYIRDIAAKTKERERQRLSLQVLSHEFRTPVAAMLVMLNRFRERLTTLTEQDQDAVMRISSEAHKLQRIIEMTKSYLQAGGVEDKFKFIRLPSLNTWVEEFAHDFDARIRVQTLAEDRALEVDPYWLRFALANLVQNAFAHGCEPVVIRLSEKDGRIAIAVEDQGVCEFESLKKMAQPFEKSTASDGMGLGLNITETIVREWGGSLEYQPSPTSFTISMGAR